MADEYSSGAGHPLIKDTIYAINAAGHDWASLLVSNEDPRARSFSKKHGLTRIGAFETIHVGPDTLASSILVRGFKRQVGQ